MKSKQPTFGVLDFSDFRLFLGYRIALILAMQIIGVAVYWQIDNLTHDALQLGLVATSEVVPAITLGLLGGYLTDTFNRKNLVIAGMFSAFLAMAVLIIFAGEKNPETVIPFHAAMIIIGITRGFMSPAAAVLSANIVPQQFIGRAAVFNSIAFHLASVLGPAFAGLIIAKWGVAWTYRISALLAILSTAFIVFIKGYTHTKSAREKMSDSIKNGLKFVFSKQIILASLSLDLFAVLLGGAIGILALFTREVLHEGADVFGLLRSAPAIGAALMGTVLIFFPIQKKAGRILLASVALFGVCWIIFAFSTSVWLCVFLLALTGAFDNISVVMRATIVQAYTPDNMRGRVASVNSIFIASSNEIGTLESGFAARFFGLVNSIAIGGALTIMVVLTTWYNAPKLRNLDLSESQK